MNPSSCDCEYNKACKKRMFGKLALPCEDEILYTIENSLDDKI